MYVVKRNGSQQPVKFDKVTERICNLCKTDLDMKFVDPSIVAKKVIDGIYPGVTTCELDELAAQTCAYLSQNHPDYSILAARIAISNLHKNTLSCMYETAKKMMSFQDAHGREAGLLSKRCYEVIEKHKDVINKTIVWDRDFGYDYFGFKTLEKSYLLRVGGKIVERPQHMIMRMAIGIHMGHKEDFSDCDIERIKETYKLVSQRYFTHATPTLFNAGTPKPQMSSCFLLMVKSDSIEGIYDTVKDCALISKSAGGIGVSISHIRASGTYIRGTNGISNGIVPMLRVFNDTARYVDQGGGKRKGSFAIYIEPWHADIEDFLQLKKNHGKEEQRARDLFYALWTPDLFMKRVEKNEDWSLFCPNEAPGLESVYGDEFEKLYEQYEREGKARKTISAQKLFYIICDSQTETGTPYILYKDACNRKSNQKNLGTIRSSNLCTEIVEYTSEDEIAVCNLASMSLPAFVQLSKETGKNYFNFGKFIRYVKIVTRNLNRVIDQNYYPVEAAKRSNMRHRPIGLGVQGLANVFGKLRLPFESAEAQELNAKIFEALYFGACESSCELAKEEGTYSTYDGSPVSKGILQFDMWNVVPSGLDGLCDWTELKKKIERYGLRNSLLVAPMPTASTAQILGNNESFEPFTQNVYVRRCLSGEFVTVNRHLLEDLIENKLWSENMKNKLIAANGSIQEIKEIPEEMRKLYKTVWEMSQKTILEMAAARGPYIDQSQSLNIHMMNLTRPKISSMHFHGWRLGLKTGMYYLRSKAATDAIKFTIVKEKVVSQERVDNENDPCVACSG